MRTIKIKIYDYDELTEKAKNRAMTDLITEWCEMGIDGYPNYDKAVAECERLRTPWFLPELIKKYCKDELFEILHTYEYYENGSVCFESEE